ncbi:IS5 family transposase [Metarhizobium album]|uniref:IS5 family transposase n=1 Tax=Metarhizobium album TaxID=2182425 RepID=A0A2U2DFG7_9HYPH|nr:IS5 family transposase [Rhizobium album]
MERCPEGLRPAQDALQPLHPLESAWRVQPDIRGTCRQGRPTRQADDRRHPSQSPSHRSQPAQKGALSRCIGKTRGGLNSKLHAVTDGLGRPLLFFLTAGQVSDYKGARHLMERLPKAKELLADRGYDADWFRNGLIEKGISPCIPPRKKRKHPAEYDAVLYKQRHRIENMFGRIKDWRRISDRVPGGGVSGYRRSPVFFR